MFHQVIEGYGYEYAQNGAGDQAQSRGEVAHPGNGEPENPYVRYLDSIGVFCHEMRRPGNRCEGDLVKLDDENAQHQRKNPGAMNLGKKVWVAIEHFPDAEDREPASLQTYPCVRY